MIYDALGLIADPLDSSVAYERQLAQIYGSILTTCITSTSIIPSIAFEAGVGMTWRWTQQEYAVKEFVWHAIGTV